MLTHVLDKTVYNFEDLLCSRSSLVRSEPIEPVQDCFGMLVSKNSLYEFLCVEPSWVIYRR